MRKRDRGARAERFFHRLRRSMRPGPDRAPRRPKGHLRLVEKDDEEEATARTHDDTGCVRTVTDPREIYLA